MYTQTFALSIEIETFIIIIIIINSHSHGEYPCICWSSNTKEAWCFDKQQTIIFPRHAASGKELVNIYASHESRK